VRILRLLVALAGAGSCSHGARDALWDPDRGDVEPNSDRAAMSGVMRGRMIEESFADRFACREELKKVEGKR